MCRLGRACYGGPVSKSWFGWLGESDLSSEEFVPKGDPPVQHQQDSRDLAEGAPAAAEALLYNTDKELYADTTKCAPLRSVAWGVRRAVAAAASEWLASGRCSVH